MALSSAGRRRPGQNRWPAITDKTTVAAGRSTQIPLQQPALAPKRIENWKNEKNK